MKSTKPLNRTVSVHDRFHEVTQSGVIVEQTGDQYTITVTDQNTELDGGREKSQVDALARAKRICDEYGVEVLFKYERTGSRWRRVPSSMSRHCRPDSPQGGRHRELPHCL
ncbi:hypothetical protein ACFQJ7_14110 [Halovenus rubra]|uniref:Uncharacterized protein n=2 Tax=Halovenus rubra TaxID=869890 RepID=A0ABD5X7Q3_9EURY|nr:hypothetical protein [Halovenus rubra]